jgi:hypothetical protein
MLYKLIHTLLQLYKYYCYCQYGVASIIAAGAAAVLPLPLLLRRLVLVID